MAQALISWLVTAAAWVQSGVTSYEIRCGRSGIEAGSHLFFLICLGEVRLSPLGRSATIWPTVPAPDDT
jgi:hypothetical protein